MLHTRLAIAALTFQIALSSCTVATNPEQPPYPPPPPSARPVPPRAPTARIADVVPTMAPVGGVVRVVFQGVPDLQQLPPDGIAVTVGQVSCPLVRVGPNFVEFRVAQGVPRAAPVVVRLPATADFPGATLTSPVRLALLPSQGSFSGHVAPGHGLLGEVYLLRPGTSRLPDFTALGRPVGTFLLPNLNIPPRDFRSGFPGVQGDIVEWFAIRFTGKLKVDQGGRTTFRVLSDDGAKLYVDGRLVVDNDGVHPPRSASGSVDLAPGLHDIVVEYFQGPRYQIALQLFWTLPGQTETIVPADHFLR